ncbi:MAG TPA: TonB-dependent receptor [Allosphingosinicella sp.]|jgi:vitamin B12 transporter
MSSYILLLTLQGPDAIVVTGSREPMTALEAPAPVHSIDSRAIERLGFPQVADALRLLPGVSVAASGPRGTQTQLRIRGSEANHSLIFVDGIRFNDPASGNEARFELLSADFAERIELLSGPQSALWGPEALGGVVAVETAAPFHRQGASAFAEYGALDTVRAAGRVSFRAGDVGVAAGAAHIRSEGIDSFGSAGERDGFDNLTFSLRGAWRPQEGAEIGLNGFYVSGSSHFDGLDPVVFRRADTLDSTKNRIAAVRGWGRAATGGWTLSADASLLASANRNRLGDSPLNRTAGRRATASGQVSRRIGRHRLTAALAHEREEFRARDQLHFGGTDQDRGRSLTAAVGEWHASWSDALITDIAVRHDRFSAFRDATTLRATVTVRPAREWSLDASYGEGIAQPTFYDLYGFFPGSFVGNPMLRPESGQNWQARLGWRRGPAHLAIAAFTGSLESEIVEVFDSATFIGSTRNVEGTSRRRGIEAIAEYRFSRSLDLYFNYSLLDAEERPNPSDAAIREIRRPRHSANLIALGEHGPLSWGASIAYVGAREDVDFDAFPARRVRLDDYALASLRVAWRFADGLEVFARAENAFDADYQDVAGYNVAGRTIHAGLRIRLGD